MSPWSVRSNSTIEGRLRHWRPDQSLVVRADPFRSSDGGNYLVEVEARQSWAERRVGGMADVHHEQRLVTAVRKKLSGDPIGIEPAHRTGHQARGADADQEVADLERGVEHCRSLTALLIGEAIPGAGIDGKDLRQLLVEVKIRGEHRDQRRGGGLGLVALGDMAEEAGACLRCTDQDYPERLAVHRGRSPLYEVIDGTHLIVADWFIGECIAGTGIAEEQVLNA